MKGFMIELKLMARKRHPIISFNFSSAHLPTAGMTFD